MVSVVIYSGSVRTSGGNFRGGSEYISGAGSCSTCNTSGCSRGRLVVLCNLSGGSYILVLVLVMVAVPARWGLYWYSSKVCSSGTI